MTDLLAMHDIADGQLQSSDERRLGRVADILCRHQDDGSLKAIALALGPEACLRRISSRFTRRVHALFKGRFERSVDRLMTIALRGRKDVAVGALGVHADQHWLA